MSKKKFILNIIGFSIIIPISFWLIKVLILEPQQNLPQDSNIPIVQRQLQSFEIKEGSDSHEVNVPATNIPQFIFDLAAKKFENILSAKAAERDAMVTAEIKHESDNSPGIFTDFTVDDEKKKLLINPKNIPNFKPGKYKLSLKLRTLEGEVNIDQDFTWGVLALNSNKSIYKPGETAKLGFAILDDEGKTLCFSGTHSAKVWLQITSPSGQKEELSTENGKINDSKQCAATSVTNTADFLTSYQTKEAGIYQLHLEAETKNGRRAIDDYFKVEENPFFELDRYNFPTRIYPKYPYEVNFNVKANQTFDGSIEEIVPASFNISEVSPGGKVIEAGEFKKIVWSTSFINGTSHTFGYKIQFPMVSPEFYLLGPIQMIDESGKVRFAEARQWQIASDAISFVKTATAISTGGSSLAITPAFASGGTATAGNLLILVCGSPSDVTWTTPAGYSLATTAVANGPDQQIYYKVAVGGETGATCTQSTSTSLVAHIYEYSGVENDTYPGIVDQQSVNTGSNCSNITSTSITTTQADELVFISFLKARQVTASKDGSGASYTERNNFQDTGGAAGSRLTTATADKFLTATASETLRYNFDNSQGNCIVHAISVRADIDVYQAGYRFFTNANSLTPGAALTGENIPLQLSSANQPFRLRLLLASLNYPQATSLRTYKLQLAQKSGSSCGSYSDMTTSTDIKYNDNNGVGVTDGANAVSVTGDPRFENFSNTLETYEEANNFTNSRTALSANSNGIWDISLSDNTTQGTAGEAFCIKVVYSDGTALESYPFIAEVQTIAINHVVIQGGTTLQGGTTVLQ